MLSCWWFQSVCAFTNVSRHDDELSEPNLFKRIDKHEEEARTRRGWGDRLLFTGYSDVTMSVQHHWFFSAYMLRLIKQYATDGVYLTGTRRYVPSRKGLTSKNDKARNLFDFYLVTCWILNMDVRSLKLFSRAFSFDYSVFFFKTTFYLFIFLLIYEQDNEVRRTQPLGDFAQISSDFQIGTIFLLCPNRFARYCESEPVSQLYLRRCVCVYKKNCHSNFIQKDQRWSTTEQYGHE